jgi:hypothetical protein
MILIIARANAIISVDVIFFSQFFSASQTINNHISQVANVPQAHGPALSQICIRNAIASIIRNTIQLKRCGVVFHFIVSRI